MDGNVAQGAARAYTEIELGGPCNEVESNPTVSTTVSQIVGGNGDRVGLLIINMGSNQIEMGLTPSVSTTNAIPLPGGGGFFQVNVNDDFTLPTRAFFAIADAGTTTLYVLEIVRISLSPV